MLYPVADSPPALRDRRDRTVYLRVTTEARTLAPVSVRTSSPAAAPRSTSFSLVYGIFAMLKLEPGVTRMTCHAPV